MDLNQVNDSLSKIFLEESQRIVFWNDPDGEFLESLSDLPKDNFNLIRLDQESLLKVKVLLEIEDPEGLYLLYDPREEPSFDEDWLLDLRLCSRPFRADRSSMIIDELGLRQLSLRKHIEERRKFFDNKDRVNRLKHLVHSTDNEIDLDRKMIAVVVRSEQSDVFQILRTVCHSMVKDDDLDFNVLPKAWQEIEKFGLEESFWRLINSKFGYSEENMSLKGLIIRLFVSDFLSQCREGNISEALRKFELPSSGSANAVVCLAQWRDSASQGTSYNAIARQLGVSLYIENYLNDISIEKLVNVDTFEEVEKVLARKLTVSIRESLDVVKSDEILKIVRKRQDGHWVASSSVEATKRKTRSALYDSLGKAAEFFSFKNKYVEGIRFRSSLEMYRAYESELYKFDQLYRQFCENADILENESIDMLKPLRGDIEDAYCNWYLNHLSLSWGTYVGGGLLDDWKIEGVQNQYDFFKKTVLRQIEKPGKRRVFVIISDALRYEVAEELTSELNGKYRFQAQLQSQLGVLPSYTNLGMASLLPHNKIKYSENGEVLVDDKPTSSLAQRSSILGEVDGIALNADELLEMNQSDGRKAVQDKKIVYIYHNEIDARGDKAVTEKDTFAACRDAINELASVVKYVINSLNGNHIFVTADHGFVFTESAPGETDRSKMADKPNGTVKAKKRYLIGRGLPEFQDAWHGKISATANADGAMEFWIPKGTSRFHFAGGARFVHGGSMPQEIVVPIVQIKHIKDEGQREKTRLRQVGVQVLGTRHKVTTQKHRFTLLQTEPVTDRIKAVTIKVGIYQENELVSDLETVTFDSSSDKMDDRQKQVILTLQDRDYDKKSKYSLMLQDADTGIELEKIDILIDRMIVDDF